MIKKIKFKFFLTSLMVVTSFLPACGSSENDGGSEISSTSKKKNSGNGSAVGPGDPAFDDAQRRRAEEAERQRQAEEAAAEAQRQREAQEAFEEWRDELHKNCDKEQYEKLLKEGDMTKGCK